MDIKQQQIDSSEQAIILRTLAESVAKPGCKFLEVGSWCGDSSLILGKIAKENNGHLFCVDWWKGNVGIELEDIASKVDVYSYFWKRMCDEGLEDVVVPIRARSDVAAEILKEHTFDFVFIDADHRYEAVMQDIKSYSHLVKMNGGILCGHDCEGRISDYDMDFLQAGKDLDYYETVHCGVVLAVGSIFQKYSINYSMWSVRAKGQNEWEPTNLIPPGIKDKRQTAPSLLGFTKDYSLWRYGKLIYAAPHCLSDFDVTEETQHNRPEIIKRKTWQEIEQKTGKKVILSSPPVLLDTYKNYNFVDFNGRIYTVSQSLGPMNLVEIDEIEIEKYQKMGGFFVGNTIDEAKRFVDKNSTFIARVIKRLKHFKT